MLSSSLFSSLDPLRNSTISCLTAAITTDAVGHKSLFPVGPRDYLVFFSAALVLFVASAGGIGGGGVLVPLYNIVARFSTSQAVALSNITILGGALSNLWFNSRRRHPCGSRPLIDWDLILVMEPPTVLGAVLGGYFNMVLPGWLTILLLAILLSLMTYQLTLRSRKLLLAESSLQGSHAFPDLGYQDLAGSPAGAAEAAEAGLAGSMAGAGEAEALVSCQADVVDPELDGAAQRLLCREAHWLPWEKVLVMLFLSGWVIISESLKRSLHCGSWRYWLVSGSPLLCVAVMTMETRRYLLAKVQLRRAAKIIALPGDVSWTPHTTIVFPAICSLAGVAAGLAGVGGGIIKAPLMLHLGVLPEVAAATSATMILFTTGAASVVYLSFGALPPDYAVVLFILGVLVTLVGQTLVYYVVQLLGRRSLIVVMMAVLMAAAAIIAYSEVMVALSHKLHRHSPLWVWGNICERRR